MLKLHTHWRDCQEWQNLGLPLSTTSNEACKLYDATLTQYIGWYDEDSLGGLEETMSKLIQADPSFVMGQVMSNGLDLMGTGHSPRLDPEFRKSIDDLVAMAGTAKISDRERRHVNAVKLCADGHMDAACLIWEDILVDHPLDMLALKFAHDSYFYLGFQPQMRDSIARAMPHWTTDMPHYGFLLGMHSFGLCETNMFEQAEKVARKGLEINRSDSWSTHSLAHVLEMQGRWKEGLTFLSSTVQDWEPCGMLACHNFWHWAVYHIEKGEHQGALDIYDSQVIKRGTKSGAMLDIVDCCSMLWRLEMEGIDVGDRWNDIYEVCRPHIDDHILAFNDIHVLISCLGAKKTDTAAKMMASIKDFIKDGAGINQAVTRDVGATICEAFAAYSDGDFARAVDLLNPIRYKVVRIGGSNAQRDLFNLFLINAALKSPLSRHHQLARHLLVERKALKENAPMTDRMKERAMALHVD